MLSTSLYHQGIKGTWEKDLTISAPLEPIFKFWEPELGSKRHPKQMQQLSYRLYSRILRSQWMCLTCPELLREIFLCWRRGKQPLLQCLARLLPPTSSKELMELQTRLVLVLVAPGAIRGWGRRKEGEGGKDCTKCPITGQGAPAWQRTKHDAPTEEQGRGKSQKRFSGHLSEV